MSFYSVLLGIHIVAAIFGIGPSFIFPILMNIGKTSKERLMMFKALTKIEIFPKVGGLLLLITGLTMGFLNTILFKAIWFDASLILYVAIQVVIIGFVSRFSKKQTEMLAQSKSDKFPSEFIQLNQKAMPYHWSVHAMALVIIVLMITKP